MYFLSIVILYRNWLRFVNLLIVFANNFVEDPRQCSGQIVGVVSFLKEVDHLAFELHHADFPVFVIRLGDVVFFHNKISVNSKD